MSAETILNIIVAHIILEPSKAIIWHLLLGLS